MKNSRIMESPVGQLLTVQEQDAITEIRLSVPEEKRERRKQEACEAVLADDQTTPLLEATVRQLEEYFAGRRQYFELPLVSHGTVFQKRVWEALIRIPYGQTRSYGNIAAAIGCPGGARAVGMACNRNPILIVVPCHRVIGGNGQLVGFGAGLSAKAQLLELEQRYWSRTT